MDIPVTVTTHSIEVDVTNEVVSVVVAVQTKTIQVSINYGLNATQVDAAIDAKLNKENVVGLKLSDSPEFADTEITPLATEATYTVAVWTYLLGLFTTVPKSVLQHIVRGWTVMQNLAARVKILEDKYILKYVVPVDTASINLTTDKYGNAFNFTEGDQIEIIIQVKLYDTPNRINFRVNNNLNSIYKIGGSELNYLYTAGTNYVYQYTSVIVNIINAEIQGTVLNHSKTEAGVIVSQSYTYHTEGLNASAITSIYLYKSTQANIPAGSIIIIKKR